MGKRRGRTTFKIYYYYDYDMLSNNLSLLLDEASAIATTVANKDRAQVETLKLIRVMHPCVHPAQPMKRVQLVSESR
jgi:hypothetical protein